MRTATISFRVEIPQEVTLAQLEEFLSFKLGTDVLMSTRNPLVKKDIANLNPSNLVVWGRGEDG